MPKQKVSNVHIYINSVKVPTPIVSMSELHFIYIDIHTQIHMTGRMEERGPRDGEKDNGAGRRGMVNGGEKQGAKEGVGETRAKGDWGGGAKREQGRRREKTGEGGFLGGRGGVYAPQTMRTLSISPGP